MFKYIRSITFVLLVLFSFSNFGCASFKKGKLKESEEYPDKQIEETIGVEVEYISRRRPDLVPKDMNKRWENSFREALKKTNYFNQVGEASRRQDFNTEVEIVVTTEPNRGAIRLMSTLTVLSLGIIPMKATNTFTIEGEIYNSETGRRLGKINLKEAMDKYVGIFLIPWSESNSPDKVLNQIQNDVATIFASRTVNLIEERKEASSDE